MAQRTIASMVDAARMLLQDRLAPTRYSDSDLLEGFNQSLALIRKNRPDAYITRFGQENFTYTPAEMGQTFPLDATFVPPVISYMVAWCELSDDQYSTDGRAAALFQRFSAQIMMLGA